MVKQELIHVEAAGYIYRCVHRIMEGDCQMDHGPEYVTIGPLSVDKYTVSNAMYYQFITDSGYRPQNSDSYLRHWIDGKYKEGEQDLPVVNISQDDAKAYASFYGKRLLSEYEWQYLAGGPQKLLYPWGNEKDYSKCNVYGSSLSSIDSYPQGISPLGLYNMCGNVWEFTSEKIYDGNHYFIVLRGGSYYLAPHYWHAESGLIPNNSHLKVHQLGNAMDRYETVGFRCAKDGM